jgi:hypothetical protein
MFSFDNRKIKKEYGFSKLEVIFFFIFSFFYPFFSYSQCAMCRAALESDGNAAQAKAINDGIIYLMIIPYVLVIVAGYAIYRIMRKKKK